jgi:hypothetical protein
MPKLKGGRKKAEGFRCYINFFPKQKKRGLVREGVITFVDKDGRPKGPQRQFDYVDEISTIIRKRLQVFEKEG